MMSVSEAREKSLKHREEKYLRQLKALEDEINCKIYRASKEGRSWCYVVVNKCDVGWKRMVREIKRKYKKEGYKVNSPSNSIFRLVYGINIWNLAKGIFIRW